MTHFKFIVPAVLLAACGTTEPAPNGEDDGVGLEEARVAVLEANVSASADRATADSIDVSTELGAGGGEIAQATGLIADFWQSQEPCSRVTVDGSEIIVDYGTLEDDCEFEGRTYAGIDTIQVLSLDPLGMAVTHDWNQFTNGNVTLDGNASVTWIGNDQTRHVETDYVFANFVDASIVEVRGDHLTRRLDPELPVREGGFVLDGTRDWTSASGDWSIDMIALEIRPQDPAPQAGTVELTNPGGNTLTIAYERIDEDTIAATVVGRNGLRHLFHIEADGSIDAGGGEN